MALRAHGKRAAAVHLRVEEALAAPVHGRIVQACPQPGRAAALHVAAHQVAPGGGVHHGEIADGMRAVEQAEAVVVAGGEHHVLHARVPGQLRKRGAIEALRGELRGKPCVVILVDGLVEHGPLAAAQHGVQAVVQKHAELQAAPLLDPRLFSHGMGPSFAIGAAHGAQAGVLTAAQQLLRRAVQRCSQALHRLQVGHDAPRLPLADRLLGDKQRAPQRSLRHPARPAPLPNPLPNVHAVHAPFIPSVPCGGGAVKPGKVSRWLTAFSLAARHKKARGIPGFGMKTAAFCYCSKTI